MSTFIFGKIKFNQISDGLKLKGYQKNDIHIFLCVEKNDLMDLIELDAGEVYFNIACGYENIDLQKYNVKYWNCHEDFFQPDFLLQKRKLKDICYNKLQMRLIQLNEFIINLYSRESVEKITYFHTCTGNEVSLDEYELVNWEIEEFAEKFLERIKQLPGGTPTIQWVLKK
ncbi:MAG: hypothetical protein FWE16_04975 [Firmicutes bacterium]|nr:hypothetical protein [Bacillota bacterium]